MDLGSIWGDFFRGEVRYVNAGLINSKYVITLKKGHSIDMEKEKEFEYKI